ncbi:plasmid partitioning protein RepA [Mesorhizobium sp. M2D.F.Ca.ET.185.01.1.1]|uniref:plasmid partitioning protein RepA n=2 Tax=Mesorhizobium TaxID=68287 RepID=UPI000FCA5CE3|nr:MULTISPECIES: plasmid partitioning protein RepA [unclassified Mesorhizobium]TGP77259.1 plasmid partitioning protein RepA [bacterium M00.F.Ca.ET.227.01.1.1]TGP93052.1 plasmid partitioning protein RepA [bacterium M00.F.Ca.ET.222.01.1.1]TGP96598.1 plasmid partitioning protein RepA [bacterium M00.F.Ca.ET.221.01.1.1]TGU20771.1 plasmid partitioning protein RepA [bacterium M00.F.Ca.ET.156.01.1.1]TGU49810.1 plasmid partitioning protein RepA [bacterium M00.F.Ca.ET.146.01.1.1]TGV68675.1 plasmid part
MSALPPFEFDEKILAQGAEISRKLDQLRLEKFPPNAKKTLRRFPMSEVAHYLGISPNNLKRLHLEGKGPEPLIAAGGRRFYTAEQMIELRHYLDKNGRSDAKKYVPSRKLGEKLQVIAVVNFKGGSGKTTTAAHLAQHLALTGHRVLAIDLDPQASLSALHGFQPELDGNPSLYDAIRYDEKRRSIADVILPTNFPLLDIIPANLELQEYEFDTPLSMQSSNEGKRFYSRLGRSLEEVDDRFDVVVIDCPPQLGFLTLTALTASTSVLVTVHPQMLDLMSMSQFLLMLGNFVASIREKGAPVKIDWLRYLITRFEPTDVPQTQMLGFMQSILAEEILKSPMVKSTAISDAGLTKQTLYEVERANFNRDTYDRAIEALDAVNFEIQGLVHKAWGRL